MSCACMCVQCLWRLEVSDLLELESEAVRICLKWVLGIKLRTFERTVCTLKY